MERVALVIEISGLQQFLKVEKDFFTGLIEECTRSLNNTAKSEPLISGSLIIFNITAEQKSFRALYESAMSILGLMGAKSRELHEYSMMLFCTRKEIDEKTAGGMKNDYYLECADSALLVDGKISEVAGMASSGEECGRYRKFTVPTDSDGCSDEKAVAVPPDRNAVNALVNYLVPDIEDDEPRRLVIIKSPSSALFYSTAAAALAGLSGKEKARYMNIRILRDEKDPVMPLRRSIDSEVLPGTAEFLTGIERKTWLAVEAGLMESSDYPENSIFMPFCLYMKSLAIRMEAVGMPLVVILEGTEYAPVGLLDLLLRAVSYAGSSSGPFMIASDGTADDSVIGIAEQMKAEEFGVVEINPEDQGISGESELNYIQIRILFILKLSEAVFKRQDQLRFLKAAGYSEVEVESAMDCLRTNGYMMDDGDIILFSPGFDGSIFDIITDREDIYSKFAFFIISEMSKSSLRDCALAAERMKPAADVPEVSTALYLCLTRLVEYGRMDFTDEFLDECPGLSDELHTALKLRCRLLSGDKAGCRPLMEKLPEKPETPESINEAVLVLEASRYFHAVSDYRRAMDYVKKVLIFVQDVDYPGIEGAAFLELGTVMLSDGRMLESAEYLSLSVEKLTGRNDIYTAVKAILFSAAGQYLWGALDTALSMAEKASGLASDAGIEDWVFFADFFKCRLYFELGRYYDAEKLLAQSMLRNEKFRNSERRKLFTAWAARACVYQGKVYRGLSMLGSLEQDPEVLFFTSEAYYFAGNLEASVEAINKASEMTEYFELGFKPLEYISWKNGFASIEGRFLRSPEDTGILYHNIRAFQAFVSGLSGDREYGIEILFNLTRDQKISENDPYNRLYFYFYCLLLDKRNDPDVVDKLTIISKALKYLQQTSSRISTPAVRQEFMVKNYWNGRLVDEAKREKLI